MILPHENPETFQNPERVWELLKRWDVHPGNAVLERQAVYQFRSLWMDDWKSGRMLLAGDAAHLTPPFVGQGICSGIRDAANLAWKLDLVLQGKAQDSLLDTYTEERKPHVAELIHRSVQVGRIICIIDKEEAAKRDARIAAEGMPPNPPFPILEQGVIAKGEPFLYGGELSFQGRISLAGVQGLFDQVAAEGWTIISCAGHPDHVLNDEQRAFMTELGMTGWYLAAEEQKEKEALGGQAWDIDGSYRRYMQRRGIEAFISRPDCNMFGAVKKLEELPLLLEELRRQLSVFNKKQEELI
jgi:hypothetical protein